MKDFKPFRYIYKQRSGFCRFYFSMIILIGLSILLPSTAIAQDYGLEFFGNDAVKDERTKLDLNTEGYYSFQDEFELSFSMRLRPSLRLAFGYVARIIDIEGNNIDIIYHGPKSGSLQIIYGQELTNISVPDNYPGVLENWTDLGLKIDLKKGTLQFTGPDTSLLFSGIDFKGKVKILFGANDFAPFKTIEVPPMDIKDIRILEKGKLRHHFPLNEMAGNIANDLNSKKKASVQNPIWIKPRYSKWESPFYYTILHGHAAICYDSRDEKVYMVGDEQLKTWSVNDDSIIHTITYDTPFPDLLEGSRVFYDTIRNTLVCYNLKTRTVHFFDSTLRVWKKISQGAGTSTSLWFHNNFYFNPDSILYIFGGYGQHEYYNLVQRYDFQSQEWDTVQTIGDTLDPRQHAAIGNYMDTIYILGGFGSKSGDQSLNPHHYKDLMAFSLKDKKYTKKYEFSAPLDDIDFAHSMVLDMADQSYYVLATTIFEFDSYLQLLKGNLSDPELKMLGDKIPYKFHNENSFSDLYFSKNKQKLIAATLIAHPDIAHPENEETKINLYTVSFPPYNSEIESTGNSSTWKILWRILLFLFVAALIVFSSRYFRKKATPTEISEPDSDNNGPGADQLSQIANSLDKGIKPNNSILFFGGFQIINKDGEDITRKFTPLLKELFLLIFLFSVKGKGISIQRLSELLWFSMDPGSAKNNRAVNIAKLKNLIADIEGCSLSRKTGYWQFVFDDSIVYNDYWSYFKIINQEKVLSREQLEQFLNITKKGPLLGNASYEWLDEFKLDCSNLIIDTLIRYTDQIKIEADPELIIRLSDAMLIFDIMHEEAISLKCKALTALGKHSLANSSFNKFCKEYKDLYDEEYDKTFQELINDKENN